MVRGSVQQGLATVVTGAKVIYGTTPNAQYRVTVVSYRIWQAEAGKQAGRTFAMLQAGPLEAVRYGSGRAGPSYTLAREAGERGLYTCRRCVKGRFELLHKRRVAEGEDSVTGPGRGRWREDAMTVSRS